MILNINKVFDMPIKAIETHSSYYFYTNNKTMKTYTKQLKMLPIKLMAYGILSLAINPVSSLAQGMEAAAENKVYELDEFVVTDQFLFSDQVNALKTPTPVIAVPQSPSIKSAADI